jgi:hypothetical protein
VRSNGDVLRLGFGKLYFSVSSRTKKSIYSPVLPCISPTDALVFLLAPFPLCPVALVGFGFRDGYRYLLGVLYFAVILAFLAVYDTFIG